MKNLFYSTLFLAFVLGCQTDSKKKNIVVSQKRYDIPAFNEDSAFAYIEKQVSFGPRVPGTEGHDRCADWLESKLSEFGLNAQIENFKTRRFDGKVINGKNIVASLNPQASKRVFLCAHWDTRYKADYDKLKSTDPILGADDGGSGVGVALEIARVLSQTSEFDMGLDIVLFDAEDQGEEDGNVDSWGLGAQHWSNAHKSQYNPKYGILLDMVGARGAQFFREGYSLQSAPNVVYKIWKVAEDMGYSDLFIPRDGRGVVDDHYFINRNTGWPVVDIIHTNQNKGTGFGSHWHTHDDNLEVIDKNVLKRVGRVVLRVLCYEDQGR
ncbi:MAG: M28 family peptidase [Saprospiraceae bacterium]|nr:M28 family peptidase [Saprospiraceae bacterium]